MWAIWLNLNLSSKCQLETQLNNQSTENYDYKWSKNLQLINCIDIETSSSYQQCYQVIDEKILDKIVISDDEFESRDYNAWRSSDSLIMLIY